MLTNVMKYLFFLRFNMFDIISFFIVWQITTVSLWYALLILPLTFVSAYYEREYHWKNK